MNNKRNRPFVGQNIFKFDSIDSTNNYAESLITKIRPPEGTAIITDYQTDGKGQFGRKWISNAGENLTFSLILYPDILLPDEGFLLNILTSVSILEALELEKISDCSVKWPNDILYSNKKLGGILTKTSIGKGSIQTAVIGIGLNVNQITFSKNAGSPIALKSIAGMEFKVDSIFRIICNRLEENYISLINGNRKELLEKYNSQLMDRGNVVKVISRDEKEIEGRLERVDLYGRLVLTIKGEEKIFQYPEVRLILNNN